MPLFVWRRSLKQWKKMLISPKKELVGLMFQCCTHLKVTNGWRRKQNKTKQKTMTMRMKLNSFPSVLQHMQEFRFRVSPSSLTFSSSLYHWEVFLMSYKSHLLKLFILPTWLCIPCIWGECLLARCHQHLALSAWQLCINKNKKGAESLYTANKDVVHIYSRMLLNH